MPPIKPIPESPPDWPGEVHFRPIGRVCSPFREKFGIPRQARLAPAARARLEMLPPYDREEAFSGLEGFSHLWLLFVFHQDCLAAGWQPMVRPPRLGGRAKIGVFASRSPYRPNAIGLSAVAWHGLTRDQAGLSLSLSGVDLLDGTPVLDIKPYVPYADALPDASPGFTGKLEDRRWAVQFSDEAEQQLAGADPDGRLGLRALIEQVIGLDPRPGYMDRYPRRDTFALQLHNYDVQWQIAGNHARVISITGAASAR
ncbi:putative tRNA (adenine(37)-N6)-methyltransferase [Thiorhodovibrio winogradskyi]|uniref:tRNA (Adenine(37)-N6)-methyltransferase n=1 Tax=Thiorhodovibrio winogradskyi TaxID=77007 RepID=A0ABZ0S7H7_9GAMM|nr:tRNA (N6-threonylcarbamoyladenosine(37)-N6)-methyltransferase TrmO [Thiorhodovibrio winogradskyi]